MSAARVFFVIQYKQLKRDSQEGYVILIYNAAVCS